MNIRRPRILLFLLSGAFLFAPIVHGAEDSKPRLALCPSGDEKADGIVALMEPATQVYLRNCTSTHSHYQRISVI